MRLVLFEGPGAGRGIRPGVMTEAGVVDVAAATETLAAHSPQHLMEQIIDHFEALRPAFERLVASSLPLPLDVLRLRPPLPRPGKILACIGNYWEHEQREARPLNMFLKNSDAVIGPGDTVVLPEFTEPYVFQHEAELAIVMKGPAKNVKAADWRKAVFGFTGMIDVSARGEGRFTWRRGSWMGKSFDTFAPLGPCITTADEIPDPNRLWVKFWNNGDLRHDYVTDDMEHTVPELVEWATTIMTLHSGDIIACGTNHEGLGPMQDGELCEIEVERIGRMAVHVRDPLKRQWE
ncbi:MAG TPA: fumarylacetoacetate hydrolase family protein, partial [Chloroflexota bacterium]|nr:fumarylacetoacetate hydrolase family protein [Chloroflexota bacterium]